MAPVILTGGARGPHAAQPTTATTPSHPSHDHGGRRLEPRRRRWPRRRPTARPSRPAAITTGATAGTAPATQAAGSPYSITRPATGTASRLATDADERQPTEHEQARHGHAGLGAERDATGSASGPSGRSRGARRTAPTVTPAVAPTDSQKPTDHASSGSTSSRPMTARPAAAAARASRPSTNAVGAERGHRAGPQHRRLGPGEHDEPADQRQRGRPARARPGPAQQRPGRRQQERHVLTGHGRQVATGRWPGSDRSSPAARRGRRR